jgi:flagellar biosynthesis/type III secretory pathway M-ring protein FliF/YscJ
MEKETKNDLYMKIGVGIGSALVLFILFGYFSKVMKKLRMSSKAAWKPILAPVAVAALQQGQQGIQTPAGRQVATGESAPAQALPKEAPRKIEMIENNSHIVQGAKSYPEDEQRARTISKLTEENPASIAEIIQIWLSEDEKNRG